jgi:hypothetical protein
MLIGRALGFPLALWMGAALTVACTGEDRDPIFDEAEQACEQKALDCPHTEFEVRCEGLAHQVATRCALADQNLTTARAMVECFAPGAQTCRETEACYEDSLELPCYLEL